MVQLCIGLTKTMSFTSRHLALKDKGNRLEQMRGEKMTNKLVLFKAAVLMLHDNKSSCGISLLICLVLNFYCGSTQWHWNGILCRRS